MKWDLLIAGAEEFIQAGNGNWSCAHHHRLHDYGSVCTFYFTQPKDRTSDQILDADSDKSVFNLPVCRPLQMVTIWEICHVHNLRNDPPWLWSGCLSCWRILWCSQVGGEFSVGLFHVFLLCSKACGKLSYVCKTLQILAGLPDTIDTYGIVSGLWTSVFALGAFVGWRLLIIIASECSMSEIMANSQ